MIFKSFESMDCIKRVNIEGQNAHKGATNITLH
jgi:hypothetical protein